MNFLLPNRFKKIGVIITPIGFSLWLFVQWGFLKSTLVYFFGEISTNYEWSTYHIINIVFAVVGFLVFLFGMYFLAISKEKIEDEMVQKTRLDSFQFAAFIQIILVIIGFLFMIFKGDPGENLMMLFFIGLVFIFWVTFISRFNYILHLKYK